MTRRLVVLWVVIALVLGVVTLSASSCKDYPDKECRGDLVNALVERPDAEAANACTNCLQRGCCDLVGACNEGDPACSAQVKATQSCVLDGGPSAEPNCKAALEAGASPALYACYRKECGTQCGVPSCDLDPSVALIASAQCDRCVGGACCESINECYGNRQCKLFLECISRHCPNTLGPALSSAASAPPGALAAARDVACNGGEPGTEVRAGACLVRCLDEFAPVDTSTSTVDDRTARCRAFTVYTCGATAGCGPSCAVDGGVIREGAYPEDLPEEPDAGGE